MTKSSTKSIEDYECTLGETLESWKPARRVAFAAAMAERWLPAYEAFSKENDWGDIAGLRRTLDAVWNHAAGKLFISSELVRNKKLIEECTPHMDDFDAPEALAASVILAQALDCCKSDDNLGDAVQAALSGFEGAVPDILCDEEEQPRLWKKPAAKKELSKQLKALELIGTLESLDEPTLKKLRGKMTAPAFVGETTMSEGDSTDACKAGITNQLAFEQYRRMVENDIRTSKPPTDPPGLFLFGITRVGIWTGRYSRRRQTIDGSYGKLADTGAQSALMARQRAIDATVTEVPDWAPDVRTVVEICLTNPASVCEAKSVTAPHGYGPSIRRLYKEGGWEAVVNWARHRPAAWDAEDLRKKKGKANTELTLGEQMARTVSWTSTGDVEYPWSAVVEGAAWRVRLNDFPDDYMYSLLIGDNVVGSFHDWPAAWKRH